MNIIIIQKSFSGVLNLDVKQSIIAQIQIINNRITNNIKKTIIHIGKNINVENPILQHHKGF